MTKLETTLNLCKLLYTGMFQYFNTLRIGHNNSLDLYSMHCIKATTKVVFEQCTDSEPSRTDRSDSDISEQK
jgi:hypothetical protein